MAEELSRFQLTLRTGAGALISGLFVGLIALGALWSSGQKAARVAEADCLAQANASQQQHTALQARLNLAEDSLALEAARNHLLGARLLIGSAARELVLDNFGSANANVAYAALALDGIDTAGSGLDSSAVARLQKTLASTRLEVIHDTQGQLDLLDALDDELDGMAQYPATN